jgi:hypothetical protein
MDILKAKIEYQTARFGGVVQNAVYTFSKWQRIVLFLTIFGGIPIYFLTKYTTNYIYYNKFSTQIPQSLVVPITNSELRSSEVVVIPLGQDAIAAYVKVANDSLSLSLSDSNFEFTFSSESGESLGKYTGKLYLLPGQEKYVVVPRLRVASIPSVSKFEVNQEKWQNRTGLPKVDLNKIEPKAYNQVDPNQFVVETGFRNSSPYHLKTTKTTVIVFDSNSKIVAVTERLETDVEPGQTRVFKLIWPGFIARSVSSVLVLPDTSVFDSTNLQSVQVKNSIQAR